MNVDIWNKKTKKWSKVNSVQYIVMNVSTEEFKLDGVTYDTDTYEINFVHKEV